MEAATVQPLELKFSSNCQTSLRLEDDHPVAIAQLVGSSCYQAVSDDALKDEDNAGWVLELEPDVRDEWVERIRWIRLIDRLAERDLVCSTPVCSKQLSFQQFLGEWQTLLQTGCVELCSPFRSILQPICDRWFTGERTEPGALSALDQYVRAIAQYHTPNLIVETFEQYEQMLVDLAGSFFQVFPFLLESQRQAASYFGAIDQFYNHLRDLQEDAQQRTCYLPTELLRRFNVSREEILQQRAQTNSNYSSMMQFWLDDYLPRLRRRARSLIVAQDLHSSWRTLCDWSVHRYRRIESVFRECEFDYTQFSSRYWQQVEAELPLLLTQVGQPQCENVSPMPLCINNRFQRGRKLVFMPEVVAQSATSAM